MTIHKDIYQKLQNAAMSESSVTYSTLAAMAGLDMEMQEDRTKLGEILGNISTYEHENNRPLLSVIAWFKGKTEPSKGFYNLAKSLDLYSPTEDKDEFFIKELTEVYNYWGNAENQPIFDFNISVESYKKALLSEGILKERSLELLNVLYDSPHCEATGTELANTLGYKDFPPVNALIGKLGKRIAKFLEINNQTDSRWWQIVANGEERDNGFTWSLRDNLFDALVDLNLLQEIEIQTYPDTVPPNEEYYEGSKKSVTVNSYERNTIARSKCISHYGAVCNVCKMDFSKIYGEIGNGFIHVHHLVELSSIKEEYKVHAVKDLRPVCPNCHAMLHRKKPAYSIEELIDIMRENA
jgi:5-methylcytosine-specific restriction enzyme A